MSVKQITIELKNLAIGYKSRGGAKIVAENLNASVMSGELTCLLGANGVGKSTLLRTLIANQPKLSGDIFLKGREHSEYSEKDLASLISIVLTDRIEIKNMSVFQLVGMGRTPYTGFWGSLRTRDKEIVAESIELVKISHLSHRMIHTLSDGERQKVMIAKALAQQTPIILLDEPTAFLDFPSKVDMMQLLHRLSRQTEKTIFLSTHDLDLALQISDRIWLMDKDHGFRTGVPEDLSLDGSLSGFFERKGILFDKDTGLFRVENASICNMRMTGHGHRFAMIRKALLRNGINASRFVESSDFEIEVSKECIKLKTSDGKEQTVERIEDILNIILK